MTAEGRFLIRTWRDATKRHERVRLGETTIPLAEHLPPIDQRGRDHVDMLKRAAAKLEALAA